jgi:PAS domain S-box-containing protein
VFPRVQRARAQSALRESEHKYRTLFEEMNEGFALCEVLRDAAGRVVDYRYLDLNSALVRHGGFSPDDLRGRRATEAFPNLDPWLIETYAQVVDEGRTVTVERHYPHVDRWMRINAFPRGDDRFAVLFSDITQRQRAEVALRESEERQAFLLKLSDALRPLADPIAIQVEATCILGRHLGAGRAAYAEIEADDAHFTVHHDYTDGVPSFAGRHPNDSDAPWYFAELRAGRTVVVTDAAQDPQLSEADRVAYTAAQVRAAVAVPLIKGGRLAAILFLHVPTPHAWTPQEVTLVEDTAERTWAAVEQARAEAALRHSDARFRAVANLVPDLLWESRPDGFTHWYNQRWLEYTGQTVEQATGWGWTEAIHEVDRERSARAYQASVESGRPLRQEHRIRRHDGEYRWFVVHTVPVRGEGGEVVRVYGAATDIHALRMRSAVLETLVEERTRQLAELNTELEARTRALEAFGELTRSLTDHLNPYALVQRAQEVALPLLPAGYATYYEPDGNVWHLRSQVGDMRNPALQSAVEVGLVMDTVPSLDQPWQGGLPFYQDHYAPDADGLGGTGHGTNAVATVPLTVEGRLVGIFAVALFDQRSWSAADRAVLETVVRSLGLALERAQAVRALAEEREALAAFARFTELTAGTADVGILAERAAEVLHATLNVRSAVYFQEEEDCWKALHVSGALAPEYEQHLREGVPRGAHTFSLAVDRREPMFFEPWDAAADGLAEVGVYQAVARYPLFPTDQPVGVLGMATTERPSWTAMEKAVFRAVGDSFRLALERAAQVQQIAQQRERLADLNAELGNLITRTAHNLEAPAQRLSLLVTLGEGGRDMLGDLPPYDPALLQDEIARLRGVAEDLRQLSSLEARPLTPELLPLGELFTEVRDAWKAKVEPRRRVDWLIAPLPIIRGDRTLLRQALDVLMTFTLSPTRGARYVTVDSRTVGGEVQVTVQDDGTGLVDEEAATLFDLAVRSDQGVPVLEGGGLLQVRRILSRHGGWAWAVTLGNMGRVVLAFPQDAAVGELESLFRGDQDSPSS